MPRTKWPDGEGPTFQENDIISDGKILPSYPHGCSFVIHKQVVDENGNVSYQLRHLYYYEPGQGVISGPYGEVAVHSHEDMIKWGYTKVGVQNQIRKFNPTKNLSKSRRHKINGYSMIKAVRNLATHGFDYDEIECVFKNILKLPISILTIRAQHGKAKLNPEDAVFSKQELDGFRTSLV